MYSILKYNAMNKHANLSKLWNVQNNSRKKLGIYGFTLKKETCMKGIFAH